MTAFSGNDCLEDAVRIVEQYQKSIRDDFSGIPESLVWARPIPGQVSAANMVLHLTGNLRHFFGHKLGNSGYKRDRDSEFHETRGMDKAGILEAWKTACEETIGVFRTLDAERLTEAAPVDGYPGGAPVHLYMARLLTHLAYHGGQIRTLYRIHNPAGE